MKTILVTVLLAITLTIVAQSAEENSDRYNSTYAVFGYDPGFVIGTGYARSLEIESLDRVVTVSAQVTMPMFLLTLPNYEADIGIQIPLFSSNWNVVSHTSFLNKGIVNAAYTGNLVAVEQMVVAGYFGRAFSVSLEASYEKHQSIP